MYFARKAVIIEHRRSFFNISKERISANMKRQTFLTLVALVVAAVGIVIALAAYFKNRSSYLYDDDDDFLFDDPEDLEYYTSAPEEDSAQPTQPGKDSDENLSF